jgi:Ca-activated chloride channel homolog
MTEPRHRSLAQVTRRQSAGAAVGALVIGTVIAIGSAVVLRVERAGGPSCARRTTLEVTTSASLAAPLGRIATTFNAAKHKQGGVCVTVNVSERSSADTATALARAGAGPDGARVPDVWIPESSSWLALAGLQQTTAAVVPTSGPAIASSPVVIAMPRPMAQAIGWPKNQLSWADLAADQGGASFWPKAGHPDWGTFTVGYADPQNSIVGLLAVAGVSTSTGKTTAGTLSIASFLQDPSIQARVLAFERRAAAVPATDADLLASLRRADATGQVRSQLSAVPIQESDLFAYNRGVGFPGGRPPKIPLVASYPPDGLYDMTIPYAVLKPAAADPDRAAAAAMFLSAIRAPGGEAAITTAGFRTTAGRNGNLTVAQGVETTLPTAGATTVPGPALDAAQSVFDRIHARGSTLVVIDGSGSMKEPVPGSPPRTKIQLAMSAVGQGIPLLAPDDRVGLWLFSTGLPGKLPYQQLTPNVPLNAPGKFGTHKNDLIQLQNTPIPGGDTPLYQTALAAFRYQNLHYIPGRVNEVVLLTDGKNDDPADPHDLTLAALVKTLNEEYNPLRPVQIVTIAYGADADRSALGQISSATGAATYSSVEPRNIVEVFINAVLHAPK